MISHICTNESLSAGLENILPLDCPLCPCKGTVLISYVGGRCRICGYDCEDYIGSNLGRIRRRLGIRRRDMAKICEVKPKTVSVYEHSNPSKRYIDKAIEHFRKLIKEKEGIKYEKAP